MLKDEFDEAFKNTFVAACRVWNAVDGSNKKRITFPHHNLDVAMAPVLETDAINDDESDGDSNDNNGNILGDVDEEHLFGDIGGDLTAKCLGWSVA